MEIFWDGWFLWIQEIQQCPFDIYQTMPFASGFSTTLSNPISIRLVLLGLVVMPKTKLVLPLNVDGHWITPTTPTQDPPVPLPSSSRKRQQPQQQVLGTCSPAVLMPQRNNEEVHPWWGLSSDL
jgi:hypothetical protein